MTTQIKGDATSTFGGGLDLGSNTITTTGSITGDGSSLTNLPTEIKAWVNYNQVGDTINSSYNVSSVTDNSTGDFTVNFTNAFSDTNYLVVSSAGYVDGGRGGTFTGQDTFNNNLTKTTSACEFNCSLASTAGSNASNPYDLYINNILFME